MTDDDYSEFVGKLTTQLLASGQKLGNIIRVGERGVESYKPACP